MAKSVNYLYAGFTFSSDWPEETARIAIFKMGGKAYKVLLDENNECIVPWEVLVNPGNMLVSVCSGNRITATDAKVQILQSGFTDKEITTQDPSIDVYTSLMDRMDMRQPEMCFIGHDDHVDENMSFKDFGMRHRAAYRFCSAVKGSAAFVISQDGSIEACTEHKGRVYVYVNVALPYL